MPNLDQAGIGGASKYLGAICPQVVPGPDITFDLA